MIIHIDLDCYFASAERTVDPSLKGKPLAIANRDDTAIFGITPKKEVPFIETTGAFSGAMYYDKFGDADWRKYFVERNGRIRGMIVTASYEARKLGVKSVMGLGEALRICPTLQVRPARMSLYQTLSAKLFAFLQERIPVLEKASIDEFYGDVGGWIADHEVESFIQNLKMEVLEYFDLPLSIGASHTRTYAKIATTSAKPFGTRVLWPDDVSKAIDPMKIEAFPGIGRRMAAKLHGYGVKTIAQLKEMNHLLDGLGRPGKDIHRLIYGINDTTIQSFRQRKSIGIGRTFAPITDRAEYARRCVILAKHLAYTVARLEGKPTTYYFKVKYDTGNKNSHSLTIKRPFSEKLFKDMAMEELTKLDVYPTQAISYIGMSVSGLDSKKAVHSLFHHEEDRRYGKLQDASLQLRKKYGIDAISWGSERL